MRNLTAAALIAVIGTACYVRVYAQEQAAAFRQPERVAQLMDNQPQRVAAALESVLTQVHIDALEAALFPPPSEAERTAVYARIHRELVGLGLDAADPLVAEVSARLAEAEQGGTQP